VVAIGPGGRVNLPVELLAEAMMSGSAAARVVDEGILLSRDVGDD
jgi:hypothetical protein